MMRFVFCHGFGFNNYFWDNLAPYFVQENCSFIDLGYFKKPSSSLEFSEEKIIGIGHSLGLLKLISLYKNFSCLVGLNSFINFLGDNQALRESRQLELQALEQSFIKDPINTLKKFYERCGVPEFISRCAVSDIDLNLILSDLEFLKKSSDFPSIPTFILTSNDDVVVTKQLTEDNFSNHSNVELGFINHAQHGLGFLKPLEVYKRIMSFVDDKFAR